MWKCEFRNWYLSHDTPPAGFISQTSSGDFNCLSSFVRITEDFKEASSSLVQ